MIQFIGFITIVHYHCEEGAHDKGLPSNILVIFQVKTSIEQF